MNLLLVFAAGASLGALLAIGFMCCLIVARESDDRFGTPL